MDPLVALVVTAAVVLVLAVALGSLLVRRSRRRAAARSEARARAYEQRLVESQDQIERLGDRLDALKVDVARAEAVARTQRPEQYLITTLADAPGEPETAVAVPGRPRVDLQAQLVQALARHTDVSAARDRAVDLVVQGIALAHGVRRALSPDTLDRAAAEAHVARRRSRRTRRAEEREARRLVRELRASGGGPVTVAVPGRAPSPARDVA